jgi:FAD binding domain
MRHNYSKLLKSQLFTSMTCFPVALIVFVHVRICWLVLHVRTCTGVGGFTLGGGAGFLSGKYGLSLDNLLACEMVLADGSLVTADADNHSDLFWAIRGADIITSCRFIRTCSMVSAYIAANAARSVTVQPLTICTSMHCVWRVTVICILCRCWLELWCSCALQAAAA